MSAKAMGGVWDVANANKLSSTLRLALVAIADRHHEQDGLAIISMPELARRCGKHRSTAQRAIEKLIALRLLHRCDDAKGGYANSAAARYTLPWLNTTARPPAKRAVPSHPDATGSRRSSKLHRSHSDATGTRRKYVADPSQNMAGPVARHEGSRSKNGGDPSQPGATHTCTYTEHGHKATAPRKVSGGAAAYDVSALEDTGRCEQPQMSYGERATYLDQLGAAIPDADVWAAIQRDYPNTQPGTPAHERLTVRYRRQLGRARARNESGENSHLL